MGCALCWENSNMSAKVLQQILHTLATVSADGLPAVVVRFSVE